MVQLGSVKKWLVENLNFWSISIYDGNATFVLKNFLSGLLFLSAATNILKKPQNKSHLATLVVWQHYLSYTNSWNFEVCTYNNQTSWVQSCDWWAGRQLAVGVKAGYQRPVDGQVDGGVVKQDAAGAIIRLSNLVFNVKSGHTRDYYGVKCFLKVGYIALI